ncbi:MAG: hypothetical protein ACI4WT_03215 [Oligosphaeraceae bacterium]
MKKKTASRVVRVADRIYRLLKKQAGKKQTTIKAVLDQLVEECLS